MFLNPNEYYKYSKIRSLIISNSPKSIGIYPPNRCKECSGSGLKEYYKNNNEKDYSWNGEYCDKCNGVGFGIEVQEEYLKKLGLIMCRDCNGVGCSKCNQKGFVDWIEKVVGLKGVIEDEDYDIGLEYFHSISQVKK